MHPVEFGRLVAERRKELGLSQQALGQEIFPGSKKTGQALQKIISFVEGGYKSDHTLVLKLCRRLDIDPIPTLEAQTGGVGKFRAKDWLRPEVSNEDVLLLTGNEELRKHLNRKIAILVSEECARFREALTALK